MQLPEDLSKERLINDLVKLRQRIDELAKIEEEKKKYEAELAQTKAMFEGLFEYAPDAILIVNHEGRIIQANRQAESLFGYTRDELVDMDHDILVPQRFMAKHHEQRMEYMSKPHIRHMGTGLELYGRRQDGSEFPVDIALGPMPMKDDIVALAVVRDFTERKKSEEQFIELNKKLNDNVVQLEAANKELEAFSYSVSHDLRAPLRHMWGFAEGLQKRLAGNPNEKTHFYRNSIIEASERLGQLIDDLLSFSQIGRTELQKRKVSLNALVREVIRELTIELKDRKISWEINELPDVIGDRALLRLVIVNLLSNAVKFTGTRVEAEIRIKCKDEEDVFTFSVSDNGVGFDMENADRLFGVFQRLHPRSEFEGTGIDLANVQRIIARHGGRVWAEGVVGQGATVHFILPKINVM